MASTKLMHTKDGRQFYKITVSRGRGKSPYCTRWYPNETWSAKTIERELHKAAAQFELDCKAGKVSTREDQHKKAAAAEMEAAKIQTFEQFGEQRFMPSKKITTSEKTRRYYQTALSIHLYPAFGKYRLQEITSAQINAYFLKLQDSPLSHSTVIGIYVAMNQLFKMAYLDEVITVNPMGRVLRPRQRKDEPKHEIEAFTAEELRYIRTCLEQEPLKWRTMVNLMIETGIRRGEAAALQWRSVDLQTCTATISGTLGYTPEAGVFVSSPKSGKTRGVYFSPKTAELLRQLRHEQTQDCFSPFVFSRDGSSEPIHPDSPTRYLQKFGKKYGIAIHPHKLRHSFASVCITNGADIASVSETLGHADKATTLRLYTHADEASKRKVANLLLEVIEQA